MTHILSKYLVYFKSYFIGCVSCHLLQKKRKTKKVVVARRLDYVISPFTWQK